MTSLEKLIADNKWQDIKDAPKDGTRILAMTTNNKFYVCRWEGWWFWADWVIYGEGSDDRVVAGKECKPTHFRPLPDDRLAKVCEVLMKVVAHAATCLKFMSDDFAIECRPGEATATGTLSDQLKEALQQAEEIARGDEQT